MNLQIAQVYLQHSDPTLATRTWQNVMDAMVPLKTGATQSRWLSAMRDKAFDLIRYRKLIETTSEHFVQVLTEIRAYHQFLWHLGGSQSDIVAKTDAKIAFS